MSSLSEAQLHVSAENPDNAMNLKFEVSPNEIIEKLLEVIDLTASKEHKQHIIQGIFNNIILKLEDAKFSNVRVIRNNPIVTAQDNFDNLLFPAGNPGRSSTYTRYVDDNHVLRTHTSAIIPSLFRELSKESLPPASTYVMPGLVYRRDVIDPRHLDVFHQIDVWTLCTKELYELSREDLLELVNVVFTAACPGAEMIYYEAKHPYTNKGIEVYARINGRDIEVLECGIIHPEVLEKSGIDSKKFTGLALGMGLERLIMARKDLPDIRLIRSGDPRIVKQMSNLERYVQVSDMPPVSRDISYATLKTNTEEDICEDIKDAFGNSSHLLEEVIILERIAHENLHPKAQDKLGTDPRMDNILARVILRHPDVTLTKESANEMYRLAYPKIHKGSNSGYTE